MEEPGLFLVLSPVVRCWMISNWMLVLSSFDCSSLNFILLVARKGFPSFWPLEYQDFFSFDLSHYSSIYIVEMMMSNWNGG